MKKLVSSIIVMIALFVFSSTAFAGDDGNMSFPPRSCQQGQTCLVELPNNPAQTESSQKTWFQDLFDFLF